MTALEEEEARVKRQDRQNGWDRTEVGGWSQGRAGEVGRGQGRVGEVRQRMAGGGSVEEVRIQKYHVEDEPKSYVTIEEETCD